VAHFASQKQSKGGATKLDKISVLENVILAQSTYNLKMVHLK